MRLSALLCTLVAAFFIFPGQSFSQDQLEESKSKAIFSTEKGTLVAEPVPTGKFDSEGKPLYRMKLTEKLPAATASEPIPQEIINLVINPRRNGGDEAAIISNESFQTALAAGFKHLLRQLQVPDSESAFLAPGLIEKREQDMRLAIQKNQYRQIVSMDENMDGFVDQADAEIRNGKLPQGPERAKYLERQVERDKEILGDRDLNKDGRVSYEEAKIVVEKDNYFDRDDRFIKNFQTYMGMDLNNDGKVFLLEVQKAANAYFKIIDRNADGKVSDDEKKLLLEETKFRFTPAASCKIPAPGKHTEISFYSSAGGALPTSKFYVPAKGGREDRDLETRATKVILRNQNVPAYLVLSSVNPMIWALEGAVDKIEAVVLVGQADQGSAMHAGVLNVPAEKVFYLDMSDCIPPFDTHDEAFMRARSAIKKLAGREPNIQMGLMNAASVENFDDHYSMKQAEQSNETPTEIIGALKRLFLRDVPGGIVVVDPAKLVTKAPIKPYDTLPGAAGLAQLIRAGALTPSSDGTNGTIVMWNAANRPIDRKMALNAVTTVEMPSSYRIVKPIKALPVRISGVHERGPKFTLAPGVTLPEVNPGYCIISEETGMPLGGNFCDEGGSARARQLPLSTVTTNKGPRTSLSILREYLSSSSTKDSILQKIDMFIKRGQKEYLDETFLATLREEKRQEVSKKQAAEYLVFDSDNNGVISRTELETYARSKTSYASPLADQNTKDSIEGAFRNEVEGALKRMDSNKDKRLTTKELEIVEDSAIDETLSREITTFRTLMQLDNGDGVLTLQEIKEALSKAFGEADADLDGKISPVEVEAIREKTKSYPNVSGACMLPRVRPGTKLVYLDVNQGRYYSDVTVSSQEDYTRGAKLIVTASSPVYIYANNYQSTLWSVQDPGNKVERFVVSSSQDPLTKKIHAGVLGLDEDKVAFQNVECISHQVGQSEEQQINLLGVMTGRQPDLKFPDAQGGTIMVGEDSVTEVLENWTTKLPVPFGLTKDEWLNAIGRDSGIIVNADPKNIVSQNKPVKYKTMPGRIGQAVRAHNGQGKPPEPVLRGIRMDGKPDFPEREEQRPFSPQAKQGSCTLAKLEDLPDNLVVYAYGANEGKTLVSEGVKRPYKMTQYDVVVSGQRGKNIGLILSSYNAGIWNIKLEDGANIQGVLVYSHNPQEIRGLPASVPVKAFSYNNASGKKEAGEGPCFDRYMNFNSVVWINPTSREFFGKNVTSMQLEYRPEGVVSIGKKQAPKKDHKKDRPYEYEFNMRIAERANSNLMPFLKTGELRIATTEDVLAWSKTVRRLNPKYKDVPPMPDSPNKEVFIGAPSRLKDGNTNIYIIQKPFTFPEGLAGSNRGIFFLKKGVPFPQGPIGHSDVYDMNNGTCTGLCNGFEK